MEAGRIVISYEVAESGELLTSYYVKGDLPVVVQLGLLEMTKDTILHPAPDTDED